MPAVDETVERIIALANANDPRAASCRFTKPLRTR